MNMSSEGGKAQASLLTVLYSIVFGEMEGGDLYTLSVRGES